MFPMAKVRTDQNKNIRVIPSVSQHFDFLPIGNASNRMGMFFAFSCAQHPENLLSLGSGHVESIVLRWI